MILKKIGDIIAIIIVLFIAVVISPLLIIIGAYHITTWALDRVVEICDRE